MIATVLYMKTKCKDCGEVKTRVFHSQGKHKAKYADRTGRVWSGRTCPSCLYDNARLDLKVKEKPPTGFEGLDANMEDCIYN